MMLLYTALLLHVKDCLPHSPDCLYKLSDGFSDIHVSPNRIYSVCDKDVDNIYFMTFHVLSCSYLQRCV